MGKSAKSVKKAKMELKEKQNATSKNKPSSSQTSKKVGTKVNTVSKKKVSSDSSLQVKSKNEKTSSPKVKSSSSQKVVSKKRKEKVVSSVRPQRNEIPKKKTNVKTEQQNAIAKAPLVKEETKKIVPKRVERKRVSKSISGAEPVKKNGQVVGQVKKKSASFKNVGITHTTQLSSDQETSSFELPKKKSTISAEDSMLKLANELKVENQKKKKQGNETKKENSVLENQKRNEEKDLLENIVVSLENKSHFKKEKDSKEEKTPSKREEKYAYQAQLAAHLEEETSLLEKEFLPIEKEKEPTQGITEEIPIPLENTHAFKPIASSSFDEIKEEELVSELKPTIETREEQKIEQVPKTEQAPKIEKRKEKKNKTKTSLLLKILAWTFFAFFLISTIHLIVRVIQINLVPMKYIYISIVILSLISLLFLFFAKSKKKLLSILQILLSTILGILFTFGSIFIMKSDASLRNLFSVEEDMTTYYVVTLKESDYSSLDDLEDHVVGLMRQNSAKVKESLSEYKYVYKEYEAIGALTSSLLADTEEVSQALIIDSNVYDALPELDSALYERIQVIYEFEIHVEKEELDLEVEDTTIEENPEGEEVYQGPKRNPNLLDGVNIGNSYIVYISGIDGGGTIRPYGLSDVNILVVVNPNTHRILLVSTPRDYFVQVAGTTGLKDKLTHAGLYGINASIGTMQNLYGVKINNYAKVTFGAIQTLVDDIGGIEVYSDTAFYSYHKKGWYVEKGINYMDGSKALAYSRERYAYAGGDRHRIKNQQDVISAIIKKVATDPQQLLKFNTILSDIDPYFTTDISYDRMQQMVKEQLNTLKPWSVTSISVNGTNGSSVTASWPNQVTYVMYPTESTIVDAQAKILEVMTGA